MSETGIATPLSFDTKDILRATAPTTYKEGWYRWQVTGENAGVNKRVNMAVVASLSAIDENGDVGGPKRVRKHLVLPLPTPPDIATEFGIPETEKQKGTPDTIGMWQEYLRATRPSDFPAFPKYDADASAIADAPMFAFDGAMLTAEERDEKRDELITNIFTFATNLFNTLRESGGEGTSLLGDEFFSYLTYNGKYLNLNKVNSELGDGDVLVDLDDCVADPAELAEA